jgi:hypothetical protein
MEIEIASILAEADRLATQWALDMKETFSDIGITGEGGLLEALGELEGAIGNVTTAWKTGGVVDALIEDFGRASDAVDAFGKTFNRIFGGGGDLIEPSAPGAGGRPGAPGGLGGIITGLSDILTTGFEATLGNILGVLGFIDAVVSSLAGNLEKVALALEHIGIIPGPIDEGGLDTFGESAEDAAEGTLVLADALGDLTPGSLLDTGVKGFTDAVLGYMDELGLDAPPIVERMLNSMDELFTGQYGKALFDTLGWTDSMTDYFQGLSDDLVGKSIVPDMMDSMYDIIIDTLDDIGIDWESGWQTVIDFFNTTFVDPLLEAVDGALTDAKTFFEVDLANALSNFKNNILDPLARGLDSVSTAINNMLGWIGSLATAVRNFDIGALAALIGLSPSPLAIGVQTASDAMKDMARTAMPQLNRQMLMMQSAGLSAAPLVNAPAVMAGGSSSRSVNVDMGGVSISNGMDEAMFEARVKHVLHKSLKE